MRQVLDDPMDAGAELRAELERRRRALAEVEEALRRWEEAVADTPLRDETEFSTISGREIRPVYTPLDRRDFDYARDRLDFEKRENPRWK
ncbi:MAG: hypothetical protein ACE5FP_04555, partial [Gemmatimonadota bacterium]